jgi:hypothetical protein
MINEKHQTFKEYVRKKHPSFSKYYKNNQSKTSKDFALSSLKKHSKIIKK